MPKVRIGHNVSNAKINSDGTFTDDYTRTFEDMVVKPRRTELKRGSYSAKNWNYAKAHSKDWMKTHWPSAVVDDKPLEEVYPEFDLLVGGRQLATMLRPKSSVGKAITKQSDILEAPPQEIILDGFKNNVSDEVAEATRRFKLFADQNRSKIRHLIPHRQYKKYVDMFGDKLDMSQISVDDVYSAMRGRQRALKALTQPHAQYSETGGNFYDEAVRYFDNQELLGELDLLDNGSVGMIESYKPGTGRKLYDAAISAANQTGRDGIITGEHLVSSPKTVSTWKYYPDKQLIGNYGHWGNKMMKPTNKKVTVSSLEDAMKADANNLEFSFDKAPVYRLTTPSQYIPVKHTNYFDPSILDAAGKMVIDLANPSMYRTIAPIGVGYGLYNSLQR